MTPRRLLVPLDGRRASEAAVPVAAGLARASGARVYLLRVLEAAGPPQEVTLRRRAAVQRAGDYLAAVRASLAADGLQDVGAAVWFGSPAAAIVTAADLLEADVIVMARSGRTGPPRTLVGSVVQRVLGGTRRPVLVVSPPDAPIDRTLGHAAPVPAP